MREILRVDGNIDAAPIYHPLYWNCHDAAIRFALLAVDDDHGSVQALATLFETAKLGSRHVQDFAGHVGIPFAGNALLKTIEGLFPLSSSSAAAIGLGTGLGAGAFTTPAVVLGMKLNQMRRNVPFAYSVYEWNVANHRAVCKRCESILFLENSFPRLRGLGLGFERWQEMANSMGRTLELLWPALRAILFGI